MINFKLSIVLGSILERIRNDLDQFDGLYLGILINSLRYEDIKTGKEKKREYTDSLKIQIEKINSDIKSFNGLLWVAFGINHQFEKLPQIAFPEVRRIILKHKGNYPAEEKGISNFSKELLGDTDSASSLARRHTALQIRNVLLPLRLGLGRFVESLKKLEEPFQEYITKKEKLQPIISNEIEKAEACYSIGLRGEAVFIIGKVLENLCTEWLTILKKEGRAGAENLTLKKMDFETKINILYRKLKVLTPSQYSKIMSIKWDRNIFGHEIKQTKKIEKDADIGVKMGISLIFLIEEKLNKIRRSKGARRGSN